MTKRDVLWIAIRILGLYFLALVVPTLCLMPMELWIFWELSGRETPGVEAAYDHYWEKALQDVIEAAVILPLALYLLRSGKWLLDFMKPDDP